MIYLLYGSDTYRSRQKLNEIINRYREKNGQDAPVYRIDLEEAGVSEIKKILETRSLFSPQKMLVVEHPFSASSDHRELYTSLSAAHELDAVLLWDRELGGDSKERLAEIKPICEKIQEFAPLSGKKLLDWIGEEAKKREMRLAPKTLAELSLLGGDSWRIIQALEQQTLDGGANKESNWRKASIFDLGDAFFSMPQKAILHLLSLLDEGHHDFNIFSYLVNHTRTLITVKSFSERRQPIPSSYGIHPYAAKKAAAQVRFYSFADLIQKFQKFFVHDFRIKTGVTKPKDALLLHLFGEQKTARGVDFKMRNI